jgi:putative transcriptional regulator
MFNKSLLVNKLVNSLLSKKFQVLLSQGSFDIAAKRENLMLVKSALNVDSVNENQMKSLKAISFFLSAYPLVVSVKNNREFLNDQMVYSRFELPVVTPTMFENFLEGEKLPVVDSSKGRHTIKIDATVLRKKREGLGFSLRQLSTLIGISKKSLYEIEKNRVNPTEDTVNKLESTLHIQLRKNFELKKTSDPVYLKPKNNFQEEVSNEFKRIGMDNSPVYSSPFEIIGRSKFSLITHLSKTETKMEKDANVVKKLSGVFSSKAVLVLKQSKEENVEGVPIILEKELSELESSKDLGKRLKEKL